ncbi:hypothetical protein [Chondromyces crocatus]|uniref:Uncharacterized protein n=1 Tax=Chondromyces crocatus TaxID=52 RepID=A0A0K1EBI4_CHOCO|nr:hypothetical protein [Chondromyces crocatus]AKT38042.1 uncharacterized protein CMC5_021830 [Chondromyces crocatus]
MDWRTLPSDPLRGPSKRAAANSLQLAALAVLAALGVLLLVTKVAAPVPPLAASLTNGSLPSAGAEASTRPAQITSLLPDAMAKLARRALPSSPSQAIAVVSAPPAAPRADAQLRREGRDFLGGGFLSLPPAFASADGAYDLAVHFHGNTGLVEESYVASGLNAAVLVLNVDGFGSGVYESRFYHPAVLTKLLGEVQQALVARGLQGARLHRLALSAWSAGYGAVLRALADPTLAEQVNAVLLLDGLHCGYDDHRAPAVERLAALQAYAERAKAGERLLVMTHSEIQPVGDYAGTHETIDALLGVLRVRRTSLADAPRLPALASLRGILPAHQIKPLDPLTQARVGGLVVRGYDGSREPHHAMHLAQMSVIALPELVAAWSTSN